MTEPVNIGVKNKRHRMENDYKKGDTIYILMDAISANSLMDDWVHHNYGCDLHVHRSKNHSGCIVVETTDIMWASRIIQWYQYKKVTYKTK